MSDIKYALAGTAAVVPHNKIVDKVISKSVKEAKDQITKKNIVPIAGFFGEEGINGASDHTTRRKINLKEFVKENYNLKTVAKRALQRASIGAAVGAGLAYAGGSQDMESLTKAAALGAAVSGAVGATIYPTLYYGAGRLSQMTYEKMKERVKK